mgnify:CR=1 FL=1|tara:strand:- start:1122 stop:1388 length:267 start_codon:yes stop_codon:yes gene_type:complete
MKAIEYFNKIEEFANLKDKEGFEAFEKCLYGLNKEDLLELIVEFTSIIAKADVSLDIIEDPFEINKYFNKRCNDIEDIVNKSHLKIVH